MTSRQHVTHWKDNRITIFGVHLSYLQCEEEEECFDREVTAINKVTQKEIICVRTLPAMLKQFLQVVELSMNVTAQSDLHKPIVRSPVDL